MKTIRNSMLILALLVAGLLGTANAVTSVNLSLDFHDALAPYGSWVHVSGCSDCWRPSTAGFVPYTSGQWVYTSYGPTWDGDEPWAWAPYHYGRWVYSAQNGWLWVPGYEWSPARVSWVYGTDYIGWNPLYGARADSSLWIVVHRNNFGNRNYGSVRIQREAVRNLFARRLVRTHQGALQRVQVERIVHRSIPVTRLKERVIEVNRHKTRLIVTEERERVVVEHITKIAHKPNVAPAVHHTSTQNDNKQNDHRSNVSNDHKDPGHDSHKTEIKKTSEKSKTEVVKKKTETQKKHKPSKPHNR